MCQAALNVESQASRRVEMVFIRPWATRTTVRTQSQSQSHHLCRMRQPGRRRSTAERMADGALHLQGALLKASAIDNLHVDVQQHSPP